MFKWLASLKLAMCLISLIVISSILATILPEDLHIYQTFWYRGLLLFFCLNLVVCTVQKIPLVIRILNEKPDLESNASIQETIKLPNSSKAENAILDTLKKEGYKIQINKYKELSSGIAQKNRPNLLAPYLLHLSLVIVFLGAFISSFGINENISCNVGETVPLPQSLSNGVSLKVEDFKTLYDQSGNVDNWQTTFRLKSKGNLLESQTVKVNDPYEYEGVKFYQSGYGSGHEVEITGGNDAGTYSIPNNKTINLANQVIRIIQDGSVNTLQLFLENGSVKTLQIAQGQILDLPNNQKLTYKGFHQYTVLNVKHDPGTPVVIMGMTLMALCSPFFWIGRYRKVSFKINHVNNLLTFTVTCRNKEVKGKTKDLILEQIRG